MEEILSLLKTFLFLIKSLLQLSIILIPAVGIGECLFPKKNNISILERFSLNAGIGFVILTFSAFILSVFHLFYPSFIIAALLLITLLFIKKFYLIFKLVINEIYQSLKSLPKIYLVFPFIIFIELINPFLLTLMPPIALDSIVYHLEIPKLYLQNHGFILLKYNLYANMPLNINMLYMICLAIGNENLPAMLHFAIGILVIIAQFGFTKRLFSTKTAIISIVLLVLSPTLIQEFGMAYVDLGMILFFMLFIISILQWYETQQNSWLIISGVFAGYIVGIKYTGGNYLPVVCILLFLKNIFEKKIPVLTFIKKNLLLSIIASALFLPWLVKTYYYTGNPINPLLYNIFGSTDFNQRTLEQLLSWHKSLGMGRSPLHYLTGLWNVFFNGNILYTNFAGILSPLILISFLIAIFIKPYSKTKIELSVFSICLFYVWFCGSQQIRFLLPVIPFFCIVGGEGFVNLENIFKKYKTNIRIGILFIVLLFFILSLNQQKVDWEQYISKNYLLADETKEQYLSRLFAPYKAYKKIEEITNKDEKILLLFENETYYLNRPYLSDSVYESSFYIDIAEQSQEPAKFKEAIKKMNIKYIILNKTFKEIIKNRIIDNSIFKNSQLSERYLKGLDIIEDFLNDHCEEIFTENNISIYKIK